MNQKTCIEKGCNNMSYAAKLCKRHYKEEFDKNRHRFAEFGVKK